MERQIGHLLRRAYVLARKHSAEALQALGQLSPVQASALAALMSGPLSQAQLGRKIEMEPANTFALVRRLGDAGLVSLSKCPRNSRHSLVALTARGLDVASRLETVLADAAARTLAPLEARDRDRLIGFLRLMLGVDGRADGG